MPPTVASAANKPAWVLPDKPLHLLTVTDLQAAVEHCPNCGGLGYLRPCDDLPLNDPRFGKLEHCPKCARYLAELAARRRLENILPFLDRYSMLRGELLAKTFDNFQKGRAAEAHSAVYEWSVGVFKGTPRTPWLYLWGATGNGKTHLAAAAANGLLNAHVAVAFSTFTELCGMAADRDFADKEAVIRALQAVPVLIVDDITEQELKTDWKQSFLFRILDDRYVRNAPTLLVSNLQASPVIPGAASLQDYEARIASRLMDKSLCRVVANVAPDFRPTNV